MNSADKAIVSCLCAIVFATVGIVGIVHWYAQQELKLAMEHEYEQTMVPGTNQVIWRKLDIARK